MNDKTRATSERFGYGWTAAGLPEPVTEPINYHLQVMQTALGAPPFQGTILDAGCGEGIDLASVGLTPGCRSVGLELSPGGIRATAARISTVPRAHLVQGNVLALPFQSEMFDGAYSYGVVHHTIDAAGAVREIVRTLKPGGTLLLYVYETFERRPLPWRIALGSINAVRRPISRMTPRNIRRLCGLVAPFVYLACTLPSRHFAWAARMPYRAAQNATMKSLIPDLYDRFAAPIEERYSERGARELVEQAGCRVCAVANVRGWAVWGVKN